MTPSFRDPLLWLRRFRKRCGYGVHSPFAFNLLEGVVYETLPYYAFSDLDLLLGWRQRFRVRRYLHLLFRLANYHHPDSIHLMGAQSLEGFYLHNACPKAEVNPEGTAGKKLVFLGSPDDAVLPLIQDDTMLLLANVHRYKAWWEALPSVVSFDLYDVGIAFFDKKYNKQSYIVNF